MPIAVTSESPARPDNPVYTLMNAVAIGAGVTAFSDVLDVADASGVAIFSSVDQAHFRQAQASLDGVTWFNLMAGGSLPSALNFTSAGAGTICQVVNPCGIRFLRVSVANTSGAGATASVWAAVT